MRHFAPQSQADLDEAVGWLLDHGPTIGAAERLLAAELEAAERLAKHPQLGRRRPDLLPRPFRLWSIPRQNLLLVYAADPTNILVLATDRDLGLLASMAELSEEP